MRGVTSIKKNLYVSERLDREVKRLARKYGVNQSYVLESAFWLCRGKLEEYLEAELKARQPRHSPQSTRGGEDLSAKWVWNRIREEYGLDIV